MGNIRPYLQLMRIPAVFTAMADILAGAVFTSLGHMEWSPLLFLLLSSSLLYTSGMVFNDYFDQEVDRIERPTRPLPSGAVPRQSALLMALFLMGGGILSSLFVNGRSSFFAVVLAGAILLYDGVTKNLVGIGPLTMGGCRALNFLLGASLLVSDGDSRHLVAGCVMLYVTAITILSQQEATGHALKEIRIALVWLIGTVWGLSILIARGIFPDPSLFFFLIPFILLIFSPFPRLFRNPRPETIQQVVTRLVLAIVLLDALFAAGRAGVMYGLLVVSLLIPSFFLSRLIPIT